MYNIMIFMFLARIYFKIRQNRMHRGGGTGEASEARASPEIRGFTTEKFLASWMYERGNFSCFTGKKLVPPPLRMHIENLQENVKIEMRLILREILCLGVVKRIH